MITIESRSNAEKAAELFVFLREVQRLRYPSPRSMAQYRVQGGNVFALEELPVHRAIHVPEVIESTSVGIAFLRVERLVPKRPPAPPTSIADRVIGAVENPNALLELAVSDLAPVASSGRLDDAKQEAEENRNRSDRLTHVEAEFERWHSEWSIWAIGERADRPVRELYAELTQVAALATNGAQEWEMGLGIGRTRWTAHGVDRCAVVWPVASDVDDQTGAVFFRVDGAAVVEDDLLPPELVTDGQAFVALRRALEDVDEFHPLCVARMEPLLRSLAFRSVQNGQFVVEDAAAVARRGDGPVTDFSPVLFVRRRSRSASIAALGTIAEQLRTAVAIPDGVLALVDPDLVPRTAVADEPFEGERHGAAFEQDGEVLLPLPVNDAQLRVIRRVDQRPLTLVQGPPGTGKTHTTAALVSHLLAKGKRVLITAESEQALREVRLKLPEEIRELSVAVLGSGQDEMSLLTKSVNRLNQEATEFDETRNHAEQEGLLNRVHALRREMAALRARAVEVVEYETRVHHTPLGAETLPSFIERLMGWSDPLGGLLDHAGRFDRQAPDGDLVRDYVAGLRRLDETRADVLAGPLPSRESIPDPLVVQRLIENAIGSRGVMNGSEDPGVTNALALVGGEALASLDQQLLSITAGWAQLLRRTEPWVRVALGDIAARTTTSLRERGAQLNRLIQEASALRQDTGDRCSTDVEGDELARLRGIGETLLQAVERGAEVKTDKAGSVKVGLFTPAAVKTALPFLEAVRVDGAVPSTSATIRQAISHLGVLDVLRKLRTLAPDGSQIPPSGVDLQLAVVHDQRLLVDQCVSLSSAIETFDAELAKLTANSLGAIDASTWTRLASASESAKARTAFESARHDLGRLVDGWRAMPSCHQLIHAIESLDAAVSIIEIRRLALATDRELLRTGLEPVGEQLHDVVPNLVLAIQADPGSARWVGIEKKIADSWQRSALASFVAERPKDDPSGLLERASRVETELRSTIGGLAALRAWAAAIDRLTPSRRSFLQQYVQLVRKLGKGTGKLAEEQRGAIRRALERCRDSVPVWIMPMYRVASTLAMEQHSFDVVVVDEASQAGLDALMLQYLAPKMVVVGDDKQVSPSAVGIEVSAVSALADKHLADSPYKDSFKDPGRSLFDEAVMRFGDVITLVEHRRCVPDIIGFSNEIAYEPDGIRLVPTREPGSSALDPIMTVHVRGAVTEGATTKRNQAEADTIVDRIIDCFADARYSGKTFGVISLLGTAQVKLIDQKLRERIDVAEWRRRELRVGQPPDFQGSERDVIFLSMVSSSDEDRRSMALTAKQYVQRYNVAASRAKDQLWVVHSLDIAALNNPEDLRRRLLEYAYRVRDTRGAGFPGAIGRQVREDERVPPFESKFEQRVHNMLVLEGFTVVPQYTAAHFTIDLVVVGSNKKLAIECDGDHWHSETIDVARDIARQRQLERCGWTFVRVRESAFLLDATAALRPVFEALVSLGIHSSFAMQVPKVSAPEVDTTIDIPNGAGAEFGRPSPGGPSNQGSELRETLGLPLVETAIESGTSFWPRALPDPVRELTREAELVEIPIATSVVDHSPSEPSSAPARGGRLSAVSEYRNWPTRHTTAIESSARERIRDELVEIVGHEGPAMALRVCQLHRKASGGQRLGKLIKVEYGEIVRSALIAGRLECAGDRTDLSSMVLFVPGSPRVVVRTLGDRDFWEVPNDEVRLLIASFDRPESPVGAVVRRAADFYEVGRLTTQIEEHLTECLRLVRADRGIF